MNVVPSSKITKKMDNEKETTLDLRHYGLDSKGTMAVAMAMVVSIHYRNNPNIKLPRNEYFNRMTIRIFLCLTDCRVILFVLFSVSLDCSCLNVPSVFLTFTFTFKSFTEYTYNGT